MVTAVPAGVRVRTRLAEDGILIAEHDRPWLAEIINAGTSLPRELHRRRDRWAPVAEHLHNIAAQCTGIFDIADTRDRDTAWEALSNLDATTVWDQYINAIATARIDKPWLRLSPNTFRECNYADGFTAQDAVDAADAWRYRKLGFTKGDDGQWRAWQLPGRTSTPASEAE